MPAHIGPRECIKGVQIIGGELLTDLAVRPSQIAPGLWEPVSGWPANSFPKQYGMVQFKRLSTGDFRPLLKLIPQHVRLSEQRGAEDLGCPGVSYQTLHRLFKNGFIKGSMITPRTTSINVESWLEHLRATQDPDFWTPDRRQAYWRAPS